MTTTEIRDQAFGRKKNLSTALRRKVHAALLTHGPCTTRQLSERSHIPLLNVRPRVTELTQLGLVRLLGTNGGEGVYLALSHEEAAPQQTEPARPEGLQTTLLP